MRPFQIFHPERFTEPLVAWLGAGDRRRRLARRQQKDDRRLAHAGSARSRSHHDQPSSAGSDTVVTISVRANPGRECERARRVTREAHLVSRWPSTLAVVR